MGISVIPLFVSTGDTMTVQNPIDMNLCSAVWAVAAFTVADLDDMLPHGKQNESRINGGIYP